MSGERKFFVLDHRRFGERYADGCVSALEWEEWEQRRLTAVLAHVVARSPFYGRHLAGVDLAAVTPQTLDGLPFTTKEDLRREQHAVLSGDLGDAEVYYETTGTTGRSTPCPRDRVEIRTSTEPVVRSLQNIFRHRFGTRRPRVALMGPSELYAFGDTFGLAAASLDVFHVKIWPESTRVGFAKALQLMRDLRIDAVVCAPALVLTLAKAALHHGYRLADFDVRAFLVLGEVCTPALAENIRSLWGAETHNVLYGSQEAHAIATGCARGRLHMARPNYLAEVLDPGTGRSLGRTGRGELCLTMLVPGVKPLVRYRTGDLVEVRDDDCHCGLRGPVVDVVGRVADGIRVGRRELQPVDVERLVLAGLRGVFGYQVVLTGSDAVTVILDQLPGMQDPVETRELVRSRFAAECGVDTDVRVHDALDPITNTGSYVSWKAARIRDERTGDDAESLAAALVADRYAHTR